MDKGRQRGKKSETERKRKRARVAEREREGEMSSIITRTLHSGVSLRDSIVLALLNMALIRALRDVMSNLSTAIQRGKRETQQL